MYSKLRNTPSSSPPGYVTKPRPPKNIFFNVARICRTVNALRCGPRLIVSYSAKRARKDAHNRQRGLAKLRKRLGAGRLTKEHLNNRGYNKFLKLTGEMLVEIDESKVEKT